VPASAVRQDTSGDEVAMDEGPAARSMVWRVRGGIAEKLTVRTGVADGDLIEVLDGIEVGDSIIMSSPTSLKPGRPVIAQPVQTATSAPSASAAATAAKAADTADTAKADK